MINRRLKYNDRLIKIDYLKSELLCVKGYRRLYMSAGELNQKYYFE